MIYRFFQKTVVNSKRLIIQVQLSFIFYYFYLSSFVVPRNVGYTDIFMEFSRVVGERTGKQIRWQNNPLSENNCNKNTTNFRKKIKLYNILQSQSIYRAGTLFVFSRYSFIPSFSFQTFRSSQLSYYSPIITQSFELKIEKLNDVEKKKGKKKKGCIVLVRQERVERPRSGRLKTLKEPCHQ